MAGGGQGDWGWGDIMRLVVAVLAPDPVRCCIYCTAFHMYTCTAVRGLLGLQALASC